MRPEKLPRYSLCCFALLAFSCAKPAKHIASEIIDTSITQLVAGPEKFDGKAVRVKGYYHSSQKAGTAIYRTRDDSLIWNVQDSIEIGGYEEGRIVVSSPSVPEINNHFIEVCGKFVRGPTGDAGMWPGMIYPVYSISVFDEKKDEWIPEKTRAR